MRFGIWLVTASLALLGCAGMQSVEGNMAGLSSGTYGVCARSSVPGVVVEACAAQGFPGSLGPGGKHSLISRFSGYDWPPLDPSQWEMDLYDPDGEVVLRGVLPESTPRMTGKCFIPECLKEGMSVLYTPFEWRPGTWRVRYTLVSHRAFSVDLRLTLRP